jgi:hypothetical protein
MLNESLPIVLHPTNTLSQKVTYEIKHHHKWFGIMYHYSEFFPRPLRIFSLGTNIIIMLFFQSITYNVTNPDDGTCPSYNTKLSCLTPKSPFATGNSKCSWNNGTCSVVYPDSDVLIFLFVALFSALVSTPLIVIADWIIMSVLAANSQQSQVLVSPVNTDDNIVNMPLHQDLIKTSTKTREEIDQISQEDFNIFVREMASFRVTLSDEQKRVFDGILLINK